MIEKVAARRALARELRKGHSVLRATTTVTLSSLVLPLADGARLLDAGGPTSTVWDALELGAANRIFSLNLDPGRRPDVIADLEGSWPLASKSVDGVVCHYVLEHLFQPAPVFSETFRCLKPGGILILTTVLTHAKHGSPCDFFRFTDHALRRLANDAGYESETLALLDGPFQTIVGITSSFLMTAWIRLPAVYVARGLDSFLKWMLPFVDENWCVGYVLIARKPQGRQDY